MPSSPKRLAIITGGTRGIGRGISQVLASSGEYEGLLLTYNTNQEAAETFRKKLLADDNCNDKVLKKVEIVGGDLTKDEARDQIFKCVDEEFCEYDLATVVHNAGQYVGITAENAQGIPEGQGKKFGNGSLLKDDTSNDESSSSNSNNDVQNKLNLVLDTTYMEYYQKLYGTAFVDICERSLVRMKIAHQKAVESGNKYRGSIIGISSPGCNTSFKATPGYDMPGSGKCVMEYAIRLYAIEAAKFGINCNVIIPGVTRSDAWDKIAQKRGMNSADEMLPNFMKMVPMNEIIEATDIGDTVHFLSGFGGGRFMTGLSLRVDAGLHLK